MSFIEIPLVAGGITIGTTPVTSGTVGSVLFIGTGGVVSENNSGLFWANSTGRLGIGTASPARKLDIIETGGTNNASRGPRMLVTAGTNLGSGSTYVWQITGDIADAARTCYFGLDTFFLNPTGASVFSGSAPGGLCFSVNNSTIAARVDSSKNWGIGNGTTLTPAATLDLRCTAAATVALCVQAATSQSANLTEWQNSAGSALVIIDSAGKVGIGTAPSSSLHVKGAGSTSATSSINIVNSSSNSTLYVRDDQRVGIGTTTPGCTLNVASNMCVGSAFHNQAAQSNGLAVERNVSIGSVTGDYAGTGGRVLTVYSAGATADAEYVSAYPDTAGATIGGQSWVYDSNSSGHKIIAAFRAVTVGATANQRGGYMAFQTKSNGSTTLSTRLFIGDDGKVGIGTQSPGAILEVEETSTITGAVTDGYAGSMMLDPGYTAATAQTVTRHNYLDMQNVSVAGAGPAAVTDACAIRFDAAAGTHKAVDSGTTKTTPGAVDAWIKMNIAGTIYYVPAYTSKTT